MDRRSKHPESPRHQDSGFFKNSEVRFYFFIGFAISSLHVAQGTFTAGINFPPSTRSAQSKALSNDSSAVRILHGYRVSVIISAMAIRSFGDSATEDLFHGRNTSRARRFPSTITRVALRKLDVLNGAHRLGDLRSPPANRLEALKGDYAGLLSIRVNDQWRLVFRWDNGPHDVSLTDYH